MFGVWTIGVRLLCLVYELKPANKHIWTIDVDVRRVFSCIRRRATLSMLCPNQVILHKSSADQMRKNLLSVIKYNNISAVHAWTMYVCLLCSPCMVLSGINKLWTSGMYDGSSLDNLYIQKDLSIITCKIMTLWTSGIVINAKQVTIYISRDIY
jgi:hypothetical protein